jgi:hypothetical protein
MPRQDIIEWWDDDVLTGEMMVSRRSKYIRTLLTVPMWSGRLGRH